MGRWKAVIPFLLALIIAGVVSLYLYRWLRVQGTSTQVTVVQPTEAVPVVAALGDIPWGTRLKPEMLKTVKYLKESLPKGHFSDPQLLEGRVTITPFKEQEPVTESRLAPIDVKTGGVAAVVTPGKRAVAVRGDKVMGLAGFIIPGSRVDVLATLEDPERDRDKDVTKVVLQNIPVLATGSTMVEDAEGKPNPVDVYTLEVTPEEGEKLSLAATQGVLQFALKNLMDQDIVLTQGADISETLASYTAPQAETEMERKPAVTFQRLPRQHTIEVIRNGQVSTLSIPYTGN
ncbi:Flp pilus assembly protein CpaB [uncultured Desulfatiglans sp.]|nr:Flp pilus assembly protein CpaB [uncultured Desulfatiglans sp.]